MSNRNILDELFQIKGLRPDTLSSYFNALGYVCFHEEEGHFLYRKTSIDETDFYRVHTTGNELIYCSCHTQETIALDFLIKQAVENYGFVQIPVDDDRSIVLDHEGLRLSILKPVEDLLNQTIITLSKRTIPFGQFLNVTITAPPPL